MANIAPRRTGNGARPSGLTRRAVRAASVDGLLEGLLTLPVLIALRMFGWGGRAPVVALVGCLLVTTVLGLEEVHRWLGGERFDRRVHLRVSLHVGAAASVMYLTGWGPTLAPGFAVLLTLHLKWGAPARVWRPMLGWCLVGIACGQAATEMGWLYSYVTGIRVHGLAALSSLVLALVLRVLGMTSEAREREVAQRERHIAERDRAERALRQSEERFRALVHNSSDVIMVTSLDGVPTYVSPSVERVTGYAPSAFVGHGRAIVHPDDQPSLDAARGAVTLEPGGEGRLELRLVHADGAWHWHEVVLRNAADEPAVAGLVINFRDVTERRELEQRIRHQAFHDSLTGLANRSLFMDRLNHALAAQRRSGMPLAVIMVDLDDFKAVNDSLGHLTGDQLIIEAAKSLRAAVRPGDTVARLGGDEFAVLLEAAPTRDQVVVCTERVLASLKREFLAGDHRIPVTASIGVAVGAPGTASSEDLLRDADVAMYVAKARGKGCFAVFEPGMHLALHDRLQLQSDLVSAIAAGDQLQLDYQPIVEVTTGRPVGVEALVRWQHPSRGRLLPDEFIPLAEETGLIVPVGRGVLMAACRQLADWRRRYPDLVDLYVSVNVSPGQLELTLVDDVRAALRDADLAPHLLVLEVTESAVMRDLHLAARVLADLEVLGVRFALDDFGTGQASFRHLQRLPIHVIKIDRCFVAGLGTDPHQGYFLEAIMNLAERLQIGIIAEGVETAKEAAALRDLGCPLAQGFLFARPAPPESISAFLAAHRDLGTMPTLQTDRIVDVPCPGLVAAASARHRC